MKDINAHRVENLRNLVNKDIISMICMKEGFEFVGKFESVQEGAQAELYIVKKNDIEYVLKHYKKSIGGYGRGFFDESGRFNEEDFDNSLATEDDRFKIEKGLAEDSRLRESKHIVNVIAADRIIFYDGVAKQAEYYSIMEKYQPLSLDVISEPNIRNEREALRLGVQICDALMEIHNLKDLFGQIEHDKNGRAKGVFHSDIKYDNIFCYKNKESDSYEYVLSDFGVSQLKGSQTDTVTGKAGGTPYTMAPEVASGHFSTKVDLYSLCATIYLLVNKGTIDDAMPKSRVVYDKNAKGGWIVVYEGSMPPPLNCSKELQELLVNGLEYDGKERKCKSAEELKSAFQRIQFNNIKVKAIPEKEKMKQVFDISDDEAQRTLAIKVIKDFEYAGLNLNNIVDVALMEDIGEFIFNIAKGFQRKEALGGLEDSLRDEIMKEADGYLLRAAVDGDRLKARYLHGMIVLDKLRTQIESGKENGIGNLRDIKGNIRKTKVEFEAIIKKPFYIKRKSPEVISCVKSALEELKELEDEARELHVRRRISKEISDHNNRPKSNIEKKGEHDDINEFFAQFDSAMDKTQDDKRKDVNIKLEKSVTEKFSDESVLKLLFMCAVIIFSMSICLVVPAVIEKKNAIFITSGVVVALSILLFWIIHIVMPKSIYSAVTIQLIALFNFMQMLFCLQLIYDFLEVYGFPDIVFHIITVIMGLIYVLGLFFLYLVCLIVLGLDEQLPSPIKACNYLVGIIALILGLVIIVLDRNFLGISSMLGLQEQSVFEIDMLGEGMVGAALYLLVNVLLFHKEINETRNAWLKEKREKKRSKGRFC